MAKKKTMPDPTPPGEGGKVTEIIERPLTADDRLSDPQDQSVQEFMDEFGGGAASIKFYRFDEDNQPAFLATVDRKAVEDVEAFALRKWGKGKYQARLLDENRRPLKSKVFRTWTDPGTVPAVLAPAAPGQDVMFQLVRQQNEDFKSVLMAALGRPAPEASGDGGVVATIRVLKELGLIGPSANPAAATPDMAEKIMGWIDKGITFGRRMEGGADTDPTVEAIRSVAGPVLQLLAKSPTLPPGPDGVADANGTDLRPPVAPGAPAAPVKEAPKVWTPPAGSPPWLTAVAPKLGLLYALAGQGISAESAAGMILANLDDDQFDILADDVLKGTWPDRTYPLLPAAFTVDPMGTWTRALLAALNADVLAQLEDDPAPADVPPGTDPVN